MPKHSSNTLDPRSPLVLDTRDLPRRPGVSRTVERVAPAPADLGVELISVPEGADLDLDLRMTSVSEGVLVTGTVSGPVRGECGRCLREIDDTVTVTVQELYAYEDSTTDATTEEDEVGRLQGDLIDLEPEVRDALVLTLPTNPTCREDCPGLCPDCGTPLDELPADHSHQQIDPRWAGLSQLTRKEE
ncbi:YceD family protein [Micromonospora sp. SH-82]|uniref:YceD family protein n=1 Tax=Micromonospora sp. SH-82 TaxID=3132938 RepID=UPI003EB9255F